MNGATTDAKPTSSTYESTAHESALSDAKQVAIEKLQAYGSYYVAEPTRDLASQLRDYAKRKPDVAAMWCFGLGVIVGWKLRR